MLELRPNCECCDKTLPPQSNEAYICSYECTFCRDCVDTVLQNVCPNCGGGLTPRPIRPQVARRQGLSLADQPASTKAVHTSFTEHEIREFCQSVKGIEPQDR